MRHASEVFGFQEAELIDRQQMRMHHGTPGGRRRRSPPGCRTPPGEPASETLGATVTSRQCPVGHSTSRPLTSGKAPEESREAASSSRFTLLAIATIEVVKTPPITPSTPITGRKLEAASQ